MAIVILIYDQLLFRPIVRLGRQVQGRIVGEPGVRGLLGSQPAPAHLLDPSRRPPGIRGAARHKPLANSFPAYVAGLEEGGRGAPPIANGRCTLDPRHPCTSPPTSGEETPTMDPVRKLESRAPAPFHAAMTPFNVARSVTRRAPSGPVDGAAYMPDPSSRSSWVRASGAAPLPGAVSLESRGSGAISGLNGGAAASEVSADVSLMLSMPSSRFEPSGGAPHWGADSGISGASGAISGRVGGASTSTASSAGAGEGEASLAFEVRLPRTRALPSGANPGATMHLT